MKLPRRQTSAQAQLPSQAPGRNPGRAPPPPGSPARMPPPRPPAPPTVPPPGRRPPYQHAPASAQAGQLAGTRLVARPAGRGQAAREFAANLAARLAVGLALISITACSSLLPAAAPWPSYYTLDSGGARPGSATPVSSAMPASIAAPQPPTGAASALPTLSVHMPQALAGYDSARMIYTQGGLQTHYFAHSEWVDTPARMLAPLLAQALAESGRFGAVVLAPSSANAELVLDTDIVRLQQEFDAGAPPQTSAQSSSQGNTGPAERRQDWGRSFVRFTLRATLVEAASRHALAYALLEARVAAPSADPAGGVQAAQQAVQQVLQQLVALVSQALDAAPRAAAIPAAKPAAKLATPSPQPTPTEPALAEPR